MNNKELIIEGFTLLEDYEMITSKMAERYTSGGIESIEASFLASTKSIKNELVKNNVDINKLQTRAKNMIYELKPYIQKLMKNPKDSKVIIRAMVTKIQEETKTSIDNNVSIDKGLKLYASVLFAEMALLAIFRILIGGSFYCPLFVSILFGPIIARIVKRYEEEHGKKEVAVVYKKLLDSFSNYRFFILLLVSGAFSIPLSLILVVLFTLREMYRKVLNDKEFKKIFHDKENLKKIGITLFFVCILGIFMKVSVEKLMKIINPVFSPWVL